MANITEQYRKPLMSDETGKAIANKLGGDSVESETVNISEQYRKPQMSEETAREILEKIGGGGSDEPFVVHFTEIDDGSGNYSGVYTCNKTMDEIIENYASGKIIYATIAPSTEVRNPFFNDDVLKVFNASSHTYQDSYGEYTKAVVFGKTTLGSNGLYSSGILGTLEDGVETWRFESLTWDNS